MSKTKNKKNGLSKEETLKSMGLVPPPKSSLIEQLDPPSPVNASKNKVDIGETAAPVKKKKQKRRGRKTTTIPSRISLERGCKTSSVDHLVDHDTALNRLYSASSEKRQVIDGATLKEVPLCKVNNVMQCFWHYGL